MPRTIQSVTGVAGQRSTATLFSFVLASSVACLSILLIPSAIAQADGIEEPGQSHQHQQLADAHAEDASPNDEPENVQVNIESLHLGPQFRVGANTEAGGIPASLTAFDGFFPLLQSPGHRVTFLNTRLNIDFDADNSLGGTVLFGHRSYSSERERILGGYVSLDVRDTGDSVFPQVGFGFERLGDRWDLRANGYVPVGDTRNRIDRDVFTSSTSTSEIGDTAFRGNQLSATVTTTSTTTRLQRDRLEAALGGFDLEAGTRLARWNDRGELRFYGGMYYLGGHDVSAIGGRGRVEIIPVKSVRLMAGIQGDPVFDLQGFFGATFLFPTPEVLKDDIDPDERADAIAAVGETVTRLADPVARNFNVIVDEQTETETSTTVTTTSEEVPYINPETGDPWRFTHVALGGNSDGTFEDPFALLQDGLDATVGDGNDIVYVALADDTAVDPFMIPDNVQVLSTGPEQELDATLAGTSMTSVVLPGSNDGNFPEVTDTVTIGSNTKLSGFDIVGETGSAIILPSTATGEIEISDNRLTSPVSDGIEIEEIFEDTNLLIARNTIDGVADSAIDFDDIDSGSVAIEITDNRLSNADDDGVDLDLINGNTNLELNILDNTIRNVDQGIEINGFVGQSDTTARIESNEISNSSENGIEIENIGEDSTSNIAINNNTIELTGESGIDFTAIDGDAETEIEIAQNNISGSGDNGISFGVPIEDDTPDSIFDNASAEISINNNTITENGINGISFNSIADSTQVQITIGDGNTISNNSENGIEFNDFEDSANVEIEILGNTITDNNIAGIQFDDIQDLVVANITIDNNRILRHGRQGIRFDEIEDNASIDLVVSDNTIIDTGRAGIEIDEILETTTATIDISDNEIEDIGADGINLDIEDTSTVQLTLANNSVQSTNNEGIDIDNESPNTTVTATGNTLGNNSDSGFVLDNQATGDVCLVLDENIGTNMFAMTFADFELANTGTDFRIVDLTNVTTRNTGSFIPVDITMNPNFTNVPGC
ncbi:MAG: right-handed parallel beta-helix repeat-containing protein [Synechococcus sp.]